MCPPTSEPACLRAESTAEPARILAPTAPAAPKAHRRRLKDPPEDPPSLPSQRSLISPRSHQNATVSSWSGLGPSLRPVQTLRPFLQRAGVQNDKGHIESPQACVAT